MQLKQYIQRVRPYQSTIWACAITTLLCLPKHMGFGLWVVSLFVLPWLLISLWKLVFRANIRKFKATQIALWIATYLLIIGHHVYLHHSTRAFANDIVAQVESYRQANGEYPESLELVGIGQEQLRGTRMGYSVTEKGFGLYYAATWIVFDTYYYDIELGEWVFRSS